MSEKNDSEDASARKRVFRLPPPRRERMPNLEAATLAVCDEEFRATWGEGWFDPPAELPSYRPWSASTAFHSFVHGAAGRKELAGDARKLYTHVKEELDRIAEPIEEFFRQNPQFSQIPEVAHLGAILHVISTRVPSVRELHREYRKRFDQSDLQQGITEGRAALVKRYAFEAHPEGPPEDPTDPRSETRPMSDREIAIVAILSGVGGPSSWIATDGAQLLTPADVIRHEMQQVGGIRSKLEKKHHSEPG